MNRTTAMILALALLGGLGCRLFSLPKVVVPVTATPTATLTPGSGAGMPVLTPAPSTPSGEEVRKVRIDRVVVLSQTVVITFTVTGQQEFLFDLPELNGKYPTPESLGDAHFTLLDRITRGRATAMLEFPRPADGPPWTLVFNPDHEPGDYVAPRVEMEVEVRPWAVRYLPRWARPACCWSASSPLALPWALCSSATRPAC